MCRLYVCLISDVVIDINVLCPWGIRKFEPLNNPFYIMMLYVIIYTYVLPCGTRHFFFTPSTCTWLYLTRGLQFAFVASRFCQENSFRLFFYSFVFICGVCRRIKMSSLFYLVFYYFNHRCSTHLLHPPYLHYNEETYMEKYTKTESLRTITRYISFVF